MKILFLGDSLTDAGRVRGSSDAGRVREAYQIIPPAYGSGFVFLIAAQLFYEKPNEYEILNRGIAGDRLPQLYARMQLDVWNEQPDVLSILIGTNDYQTETNPNFTDVERWGRIYRMLIRDTKERCPHTRIILCEPFTAKPERKAIQNEYATEAKKIAKEFDLPFVPLQEKIEKTVEIYGLKTSFHDGTHPNLVGSKAIADEWLKIFKQEIANE